MSELVRKLKADEEGHVFEKYLQRERGHAAITPQDLKEIDTAGIIHPNDTEKLLQAEDLGNGFCLNPAGGVYAQQTIEVKGITCDMLNWWYAFYPLESYRYFMWMPESHHSVAIADCDREKIVNPVVPMKHKSRGVLHAMLRNEGQGMKEVNVRFLDPLNAGFDMGLVETGDVKALFTGWKLEQALDQLALPNRFPLRNYAIETIIARDTEEGIKANVFTWIGWRYDCDGKAGCALPPGVEIPKEAAFGTLLYAPQEWTALGEFLPELYQETGGIIQ